MTLDEAVLLASRHGVYLLKLGDLLCSTRTLTETHVVYITYTRANGWTVSAQNVNATWGSREQWEFKESEFEKALTLYLMLGGQRDTR